MVCWPGCPLRHAYRPPIGRLATNGFSASMSLCGRCGWLSARRFDVRFDPLSRRRATAAGGRRIADQLEQSPADCCIVPAMAGRMSQALLNRIRLTLAANPRDLKLLRRA